MLLRGTEKCAILFEGSSGGLDTGRERHLLQKLHDGCWRSVSFVPENTQDGLLPKKVGFSNCRHRHAVWQLIFIGCGSLREVQQHLACDEAELCEVMCTSGAQRRRRSRWRVKVTSVARPLEEYHGVVCRSGE